MKSIRTLFVPALLAVFAQSAHGGFGNGSPAQYKIGDIDGNGVADLYFLDPTTAGTILGKINNSGKGGTDAPTLSGFGDGTPGRYLVANSMTYDGFSGLFFIGTDGKVYGNTYGIDGSGWQFIVTSTSFGDGSDSSRYFAGDIDGDGLTDVFYVAADGTVHGKINNSGTGWSDAATSPVFGDGSAPSRYRVVDLDGDGCADLLYVGSDGTVQGQINDYGQGWSPTPSLPAIAASDADKGKPARYFVADIDGDGGADVIFVGSDGTLQARLSSAGQGWTTIASRAPLSDLDVGNPARYRLADITGTGTKGLFFIGSGGIVQGIVWQNTTGSWAWAQTASSTAFGNGDPSRYFVADIDGDGCDDLLYIGSDGASQCLLNQAGQSWISGTSLDVNPASPSAPTLLAVTGTTINSIVLAWSPSSGGTGMICGYRIYRYISRNGANTAIQVGTSVGCGFVDSTPAYRTTFCYYVVAFDLVGHVSAASSPVSAQTSLVPGDGANNTAVTGLPTWMRAGLSGTDYGSTFNLTSTLENPNVSGGVTKLSILFPGK